MGVVVREALPALLQEIADAVEAATGDRKAALAAALTLAEVRGGTRVYIPVRPGPDHWLVQAVGPAAAAAIASHFATDKGAELELPVGPSGSFVSERRRRARLYAESASGNLSADAAAQRAGVTRRMVQYARAKMRQAKGQQRGLFDDDDAA
jgi:hypothetical protein